MIKKIFLLSALFILIISFSSFSESNFDIKSYYVKLDIKEDTTINFQEIVSIDFKEKIDSIQKRIPIHYNGYNHKLENIKVIDPITKEDLVFKATTLKNSVLIDIFSSSLKGIRNFKIEYQMQYGDDFILFEDIFKMQLIKNDYKSSIPITKFEINFDKKVEGVAKNISFTLGSTEYSKSENIKWEFKTDKSIVGYVRYLYPYEGLKVKINFDNGFFKPKTKVFDQQRYIIVFSVMGFIIILSLVFKSIVKKPKVAKTLTFLPPEDMSSLEIAENLKDYKVGDKDIMSLIVHWATKEYINIVEKDEKIFLEKRVANLKIKNKNEKDFFRKIFEFGTGSIVKIEDLNEEFFSYLKDLKKNIYDKRNEKSFFNKETFIMFLVSSIFALFITYFLTPDIIKQVGGGYFNTFISLYLLMIFLHVFTFQVFKNIKFSNTLNKVIIYTLVFVPVIVLYALLSSNGIEKVRGLILDDFEIAYLFNIWKLNVFSTFVLSQITMFFITNVNKYSKTKLIIKGKIEGFKSFLSNVTVEELNSIYYDNNEYYYQMIPYCMVFDSLDKWTTLFSQIKIDAPKWYSGEDFEIDRFIKMFKELEELDENKG